MFDIPLSKSEQLAASVLGERPVRPRDATVESQALDELISRIHTHPNQALQALAHTVADLCKAGSAGISILEGDHFVWSAIAGEWAKYVGQGLPRDASPCGVVIAQNAALLFDRPNRLFPNMHGEPEIREILLVPLVVDGRIGGTIWAVSHDDAQFDAEDARILERLGLFASAVEDVRRARIREGAEIANARSRVRATVAMMRQLLRAGHEAAAGADAAALSAVSSRLAAYAAGLLGGDTGGRVNLWSLLADILAQYGETPDQRVGLSGPDVSVPADRAGPLGLAFNELLENAIKYGALANSTGQVEVTWWSGDTVGSDSLHLSWVERSGHPVTRPAKYGFGLDLLDHGLPALIGGETHMVYDDDGLRFSLVMLLIDTGSENS